MHVETTTWSPDEGWHEPLPVPDGRASLVLVAAAPRTAVDPTGPLEQVRRTWHGQAVVGMSTAAHATDVDLDDAELLDDGVSVAVLRFEHSEVRISHHEIARSGGARRAARRLATDLADPRLRGVLVVGGGRSANPSSVVQGFTDILPGVDVVGAIGRTGSWSLVDVRPAEGWLTAVGLVGDDVIIGHGVASGWEPQGGEHLVTASYGDVVYTIDDAPALDIHRRAGQLAGRLTGRTEDSEAVRRRALLRPMSVRDLDDRPVTRSVVDVDTRTGAVRCGGDVTQGSVVQLMDATADSLVHAAHLAAKEASVGSDQFAFVLTGAPRAAVLGTRAMEELGEIRSTMAHGCRLLALQSDAELSATGDGADTGDDVDRAHNAAVTVTTIGEATS